MEGDLGTIIIWLRLKVVSKPPIMAEITPAMGGTAEPEAIDMPSPSGNATNATLKAAIKSCLQFCLNPAKPVLGRFKKSVTLINWAKYRNHVRSQNIISLNAII